MGAGGLFNYPQVLAEAMLGIDVLKTGNLHPVMFLAVPAAHIITLQSLSVQLTRQAAKLLVGRLFVISS